MGDPMFDNHGFSVRHGCAAKPGIARRNSELGLDICEEKGTSQTQRPVSLQRAGYEDSALKPVASDPAAFGPSR